MNIVVKRFQFDFKEYFNETRKGFIFYETLMELKNINKLELLRSLNIPITSYRVARKKEQTNGKEILLRWEKHFGFNSLSLSQIEEYEETLSNLYRDIYYRRDEEIKKGENLIDMYISENNILSLAFKLFKILIIFTENKRTPSENKEKCKKLYEEVLDYYDFFNDELKMIFQMVECLMSDDEINVNEIFMLTSKLPYFKGMMYSVLSLKAHIDGNYDYVIIYSKICEDEFIKHQNCKRLWIMQLNRASAFNAIRHFGLAYSLCEENLLTMDSFNIRDAIYYSTIMQYYVAIVGMNKDNEILKFLSKKDEKTTFDYLILMLIHYKAKEIDMIDLYYNEIIKKINKDDQYYNITNCIYEIFKFQNVEENILKLKGKFNVGYIELLKILTEVKK